MNILSTKTTALFGAAVLALSFAACGGESGTGGDDNTELSSSSIGVNDPGSSSEIKSSSSSNIMTVSGTFTDERDNKEYKWVEIGTQTWMAENLNHIPETGNSWCYKDDDSNCDTYGRLYDWGTAMEDCPDGWHLPSSEEWNTLVNFVGSSTAGTKLKSKTGWIDNGNGLIAGTDDYGFNALPGGYRSGNDGSFSSVGSSGLWWTATESESSSDYAQRRNTRSDFTDMSNGMGNFGKISGYSVRCVKD
ncbi:MAG: fibrobacter succinogenes major paralogous domain-containing protein [Fibrobacter sp.]|jgi:uncharacterized protein (TIGR02145 family)|nr:fibrobacter succinogenes major paralogous domain-containing protein [Fibrobacter sp.]